MKNHENPRFWQVFLVFFKQNDDFLMIFSMIFEGFASKEKIKQNLGNHQKEKIKQNLGNHQKIIVLLEKNQKTCQNLGFSRFFQQNDDFLMIF